MKPVNCPKCNSTEVASILYGMPVFNEIKDDLEAGRIVLGGCCIGDDSTEWHCNQCQHRWGEIHKMKRHNWEALNRQQVGAYAEYFVKMELTMYGFQVFTTEVDDRGIDFVTKYENGPYLEIQVKSLRKPGYVFMQKEKFALKDNLYLALVLLNQSEAPVLYLIPSSAWTSPDETFVDRDYENLKSKPEWGINLSKKNLPNLEKFRFEKIVSEFIEHSG